VDSDGPLPPPEGSKERSPFSAHDARFSAGVSGLPSVRRPREADNAAARFATGAPARLGVANPPSRFILYIIRRDAAVDLNAGLSAALGVSAMRLLGSRSSIRATVLTASARGVIACAVVGGLVARPAEGPDFAMADVHPSAANQQYHMPSALGRGGRYEVTGASLVDLVGTAYGVERYQVLGGPVWLASDRFDVIAKAPPTTPQDSLGPMMQSLLAERFKLVAHRDSREIACFRLQTNKDGLNLRHADGSDEGRCRRLPQAGAVSGDEPAYLTLSCRGVTMRAFASTLREYGEGYVDAPVIVDATGLQGLWDFDVRWSMPGQPSGEGGRTTLFDALSRQLGLRLERGTVTMPVVVVDNVNRAPTPNLPGVADIMQAPAEFEVASVKPSVLARPQGRGLQNGKADLLGRTLEDLITRLWGIRFPEMLVGAPNWLDSDRFDIVAEASSGPSSGPEPSSESLQLMLRSLLVERFKIAIHTEDRPMDVYALVRTGALKLDRADESSRSSCKWPMIIPGLIPRTFICQNTTMATLAGDLPQMATAYIDRPVVDATGLAGGWDFTLNFDFKVSQHRAANDQEQADQIPSAAVPTGGMTVFEALEKELGLKLERQKHPMPVFVIDHIDRTPTEN